MSLVRNTATIGGLTLVSRILGFVRDMLMARFVGAGFASDAFLIAWRLPNLFRALFAEGAFASAFVPMFNRTIAGAEKDGRAGLPAGLRFAENVAVGAAAGADPFHRADDARRRADRLGDDRRLSRWRAGEARAGDRIHPHHLSLSDADLAGVAARRHPQFARPLLGQRGGAGAAQPVPDCRAAVLPRPYADRYRAHAVDRRHRLRRAPARLADLVVPPGRRVAAAEAPAPDARR